MALPLVNFTQEDPSFRVHTDEESAQTIISGMGELHLDVLVDRMKESLMLKLILVSRRFLIVKQLENPSM